MSHSQETIERTARIAAGIVGDASECLVVGGRPSFRDSQNVHWKGAAEYLDLNLAGRVLEWAWKHWSKRMNDDHRKVDSVAVVRMLDQFCKDAFKDCPLAIESLLIGCGKLEAE